MTKDNFEKYDGLLHCLTCGKDVPKIHINYRKVHKNGDILRCNVCEWIKAHPDKLIHEKFTKDEIIEFLHLLMYEKCIYLNDICNLLNRNLDDIIELYQFLKIFNKSCSIKTHCELCGKECEFKPLAYLKSKYHYCSHECYYQDKSNKMLKGQENPCFNRIETECTNCKKTILIIPYDYNIRNQYGDNHNFCSKECYWAFRSKYYIGEKTYNYQREYSEEEKNIHQQNLLNRLNKDDRLDTDIQLKIDSYLDKNNIHYIREKVLDYYAVDNYITKTGGIIEVMGDYWHTSPLKYNKNKYKINDIQAKQLHRDKIKYSYIKNHYGTEILYLWETDINKHFDVCAKLINEYLSNNNILSNYHSFNWTINEDTLVLNKNLIIPYQDISVDQYRYLINKKVI